MFTLITNKTYIAAFSVIYAVTADSVKFAWKNTSGTTLSGVTRVFRNELATTDCPNASVMTVISTAGGTNLTIKVVVFALTGTADARGASVYATIHQIS